MLRLVAIIVELTDTGPFLGRLAPFAILAVTVILLAEILLTIRASVLAPVLAPVLAIETFAIGLAALAAVFTILAISGLTLAAVVRAALAVIPVLTLLALLAPVLTITAVLATWRLALAFLAVHLLAAFGVTFAFLAEVRAETAFRAIAAIGVTPALLLLLFLRDRDDAVIVLRMLQIVFRNDPVA